MLVKKLTPNPNLFIDTGFASLNKQGEELCGDKVDIVHRDDSVIMILSDGLGSGVKANILATLTTKIAGTMLEKGANIEEVVETVGKTLPTCKVRELAYSTFTIVQVFHSGHVYLAEFDNPGVFFLRGGYVTPFNRTSRIIANKTVKEAHLEIGPNDYLVVVSDGVVHAGIGGVLNLGWQWSNIGRFLEKAVSKKPTAQQVAVELISICEELYMNEPGDDSTVAVIAVRSPRHATVVIGPPLNPRDDRKVARLLRESPGKKIVCGGTTSSIIAREWGEELTVDLNSLHPQIPPMGRIKGVDLVTEGIITITGVLEKLRRQHPITDNNGVDHLAKTLKDSDSVHFLVGRAINPAHQNPELPYNVTLKQQVIAELAELLTNQGKEVEITFF
ncbi:MAG: SpoIIE family protein phosphatase [Limnochordia bacterium]